MSIDDIAGTKSRRIYRGVAKNILSNSDIDGSMSKHDKLKPKPYDLMDYSDVTGKKNLY